MVVREVDLVIEILSTQYLLSLFLLLRSPQKDSLVYEESKKTVEFEADGR